MKLAIEMLTTEEDQVSELTRYEDTAPVDYMVKSPTGDWVPASEALALEAELTRWRAMFSRPEIAARHLDEIHAQIDAIQRKLTAPLEFDATVERLIAVAKAHGWTLRSWGLTRIHPEDEG